jgi:hypothetical protein
MAVRLCIAAAAFAAAFVLAAAGSDSNEQPAKPTHAEAYKLKPVELEKSQSYGSPRHMKHETRSKHNKKYNGHQNYSPKYEWARGSHNVPKYNGGYFGKSWMPQYPSKNFPWHSKPKHRRRKHLRSKPNSPPGYAEAALVTSPPEMMYPTQITAPPVTEGRKSTYPFYSTEAYKTKSLYTAPPYSYAAPASTLPTYTTVEPKVT